MFGDKQRGSGSKQMQPGQRPVMGEPNRGRYRINPDGSVDQWDGSGYSPRSSATMAPDAQTALEGARSDLSRYGQAYSRGQDFLRLNSRQSTGGALSRVPVLNTFLNSSMSEMERIQNDRVFSQIAGEGGARPIAGTAIDTERAMGRLESTGPRISAPGPANRTAVLRLAVERDLAVERLTAMEDWVRDPSNRSIEGFAQYWTREGPRRRAAIQQRYEAQNGPVDQQDYAWGAQRPNPFGSGVGAMVGRQAGQAPQGQQQQQRRRRFNPDTGQIE
jgi:hypothetical protein